MCTHAAATAWAAREGGALQVAACGWLMPSVTLTVAVAIVPAAGALQLFWLGAGGVPISDSIQTSGSSMAGAAQPLAAGTSGAVSAATCCAVSAANAKQKTIENLIMRFEGRSCGAGTTFGDSPSTLYKQFGPTTRDQPIRQC